MPHITKGTRIRASWMDARPVSLAGMQMKMEAVLCQLDGVVRHLRGDHPTEPTIIRLHVEPDPGFGPPRGAFQCKACGVTEVEVNPAWVTQIFPPENQLPPAAPPPEKPPGCDHGLLFSEDEAREMTTAQIRERFPRLYGPCPKGCGFSGIAYASMDHYRYGDW